MADRANADRQTYLVEHYHPGLEVEWFRQRALYVRVARTIVFGLSLLTLFASVAQAGSTLPAESFGPGHFADPARAADVPQALVQVRRITAQINARNRGPGGSKLAVTEASSTGVIESFSLLSASLDELRIVPADTGIYFAICPLRATCPNPARRSALPAAAFSPRRQALELAVRTFIETSADVVAVSLPTSRFVLFIVERQELDREIDMPALAERLAREPASAADASLRVVVDQLTYARMFAPVSLESTPNGRDTLTAIPLRPSFP